MKTKISLFLIVLLFINCKSTEEAIQIEQLETILPVIIQYDSKKQRVWSIDFPIEVEINNKSFKKKIFTQYDYYYYNEFKGKALRVYEDANGILQQKSRAEKKHIVPFSSKTFILYSRHFIDTNRVTQLVFNSYVDKMMSFNQDTLAVGSISKFKTKHPKLVQQLLTKDSISFWFLTPDIKDRYAVDIKIPVKF